MTRSAFKTKQRLIASLVSLVLAAGAARGDQQKITDDNVDLPAMALPQLRYVKVDVEAEQVSDKSDTGLSTRTQRTYVSPAVGIGWDYFVYHPNLLTFQLLAEPGYAWQKYNTDGTVSRQDSLTVNGNFNATLLRLKPYATVFNYSRGHGDYHYDFYSSTTVDSETYGLATGYSQGPVPTTISYQHVQTDSSGLQYNSSTEQATVMLHALNERRRGSNTDLNYQYSAFNGTYSNTEGSGTSETTHSLTIADIEHFAEQLSLNSTLYYNHYDTMGVSSDNPTVLLYLDWQHTPRLRSYYSASVADYISGGSESLNTLADVGLQYQLYESLTSTVDVHSGRTVSDYGDAHTQAYTIGAGNTEAYSKRLGDWGNLSLMNSADYSVTQQDSTGGEIPVFDESHNVLPSGWFVLSLPNVTSVTSVTYLNAGGTLTLDPSTDYSVIPAGDVTQIQITPSGMTKLATAAPPATSVKVDYLAAPNPTGNYTTFSDQAEIRLGFWQQRAGVYARYSFAENWTDTPGFVFDNFRQFQAGTDLNWHKLRLDATYTDRNSSIYSYQELSFSEGYTLISTLNHSAGLDFHQLWNRFTVSDNPGEPAPDMTYYSFTGHYEWHPVSRFSWRNDAGYELQRGGSSDRNYFLFHSYIRWYVGKLDFNLGYEHQHQVYTSETRERDYAFLRIKRNF